MKRGAKAILWLSRAAAAFWLMVTLALAAVWIHSHRSPAAWQRTRWELTAATDEWWDTRLLLADGVVSAAFTHETAPAFVGQVVGAGGAIAPDRVQPSGVTWKPIPVFATFLIRDDAPPIAARLGLGWELRQPMLGSSEMFPGERGGVQVALWLPTMVAAMITLFSALLSRRAARPLRRARAGMCSNCGYDLRGSPGRCPECGAATPL